MGFTSISSSAHVIASKYKVLSSAVKMYNVSKKADKEMKKKEKKEKAEGADTQSTASESRPSAEISQKSFGSLVETLWSYTVVDVESTLRSVCIKVLKDSSVPKEVREKRAEGLLIMGEIFAQKGQSEEKALEELTARFAGEQIHEAQA